MKSNRKVPIRLSKITIRPLNTTNRIRKRELVRPNIPLIRQRQQQPWNIYLDSAPHPGPSNALNSSSSDEELPREENRPEEDRESLDSFYDQDIERNFNVSNLVLLEGDDIDMSEEDEEEDVEYFSTRASRLNNRFNNTIRPTQDQDSSSSEEEEDLDEIDNELDADHDFPIEVAETDDEASTRPIMYYCTQRASILVILENSSTLALKGAAEISSLSGTVEILGYAIHPDLEKPVHFYSSPKSCYLSIKTKMAQPKTTAFRRNLMRQLSTMMLPQYVSEIINTIMDRSIILLFKTSALSQATNFTHYYVPEAVPMKFSDTCFQRQTFNLSYDCRSTIEIPMVCHDISTMIDSTINKNISEDKHAPVVLAWGAKDAGKSTILRYMINSILRKHGKVYYLDTDLGQTEFTPPGCASLFEVNLPLLGSPYTHPKKPIRMSFLGTTTIKNAKAYGKAMERLIDHYTHNFKEYPLFVNTCGWIKADGKACLEYIKRELKPHFLLNVVTESLPEDPETDDDNSNLPDDGSDVYKFKITRIEPQVTTDEPIIGFKPYLRRDLNILSYFGLCKGFFKGSSIQAFKDIVPLTLVASDIVLHNFATVCEDDLLDAFNACFVALCVVDESNIRICPTEPRLPKVLAPGADFSECLGFGFVRAVDLVRNLLYIITPEPPERLRKINALVKSEIMMPDLAFINQKLYREPLSHIMYQSEKNFLSHKIMRLNRKG